MQKVSSDEFFARLDSVTDYETLTIGLYGECKKTGAEVWLACPYDEDTKKDKFSVNIATGQWKNHKTDEGGGFISLIKKTHASSWRDEWARIVPQAADVLFPDTHRAKGPLGSDASVKRRTFAARAKDGRERQDHKDLAAFVEAYRVPDVWMMKAGVFTQKGGRLGPTPRLIFAGVDPSNGTVCGLKMRSLTASIPVKSGKKIKSKNMAGSTAGLIGWDPNKEGIILFVEGEKDWLVAAYEFPQFLVVTNTNGAKAWKEEWSAALKDRDVIFLYDEDDAGNVGSRKAAARILPKAKSVKIAHFPGADKDMFDHLRGDGVGKEAVLAIINSATIYDPKSNPAEVDGHIRAACSGDDMDANVIADTLHASMSDNGALFMQVDDREAFCAWRGKVYDCNPQNKFWQNLIYFYTGKDAGSAHGARVLKHVAMLAVAQGRAVEQTTWFARRDGSLFLPLYGEEQKMVEITKDSVTVVPNGYREVVLMPVAQIKEVKYLTDDMYDGEAAEAAWKKLWNYMNCTPEWRDLVSAVTLALPFYDWCETHPLLRFQGMTGSGKSFATKAMTTLLYGQPENQGGDTMAAMYRMAGSRMLLALDNLEDTNLRRSPDLKDLMLRAASGMTRAKSAADSERAIVAQRVTCWIMSTGKSPIGAGYEDMEERLVVVPIGGNEQDGFYGTGIIKWIQENRDLLYSYWIRNAQSTLRAILEGQHLHILRQFPPTHRHRLHEWYAMLSLCRGDRDRPSQRVLDWLGSAHAGESSSVVESDPIVPLLALMPSFLESEYEGKSYKFLRPVLHGSQWELIVHTKILHTILSTLARRVGQRYNQSSGKALGYHLRSLARRSSAFGIDLSRVESRTTVPGTGERDRSWSIRLQMDVIEAIHGPVQTSFMTMSGEQIRDDGSDDEMFVDREGVARF